VALFFVSEKEPRRVRVLRGEGLAAELSDTDPQQTGVPPLPVGALTPAAGASARVVQGVLDQAMAVLRDEPRANAVLARGFAAYEAYPSFAERFKLRALAIARYPMYRGVARLVGMDVGPVAEADEGNVAVLAEHFDAYDFFFVHFKYADSRGEDGDFAAKVKAIEAVDRLIPGIEALEPDVLIVGGDHSTPAGYRAHSWHPVPVLIRSKWTRGVEAAGFGERYCRQGELGIFPARHLMTLALAHAGRLAKFGA
jgi:2,3-bisphosphoglycerate-independent phosphoglycerate mutase